MTPQDLPDPIAAYFAADLRAAAGIARCFTPDAVVKDEGRRHAGHAAIDAWKAAASTAYAYTSVPIAHENRDGEHVVTSRVAGNFPGSPVELQYRFRLERGLISSLEITA